MNILAIETATEACSAALLTDGRVLDKFEHQPQQQAKLILPMIDALLSEAGLMASQLDAVAFGAGPGSFTGLRIAASVAQAIAVVDDLPVLPVSTLAALAQGVYRQHQRTHVLAAIDARMQEVYWGVYALNASGVMELHGEEQVLPPMDITPPVVNGEGWVGGGSGWRAYADTLTQALSAKSLAIAVVYDDLWPSARDVLTLAVPMWQHNRGIPVEQAIPVYLRDKVAQSRKERLQAKSND